MSRVIIGRNYEKQPLWKKYFGVPFIYLPIIIMIPFVILGTLIIRFHLTVIGGMNIRSYWTFVPAWASHRYHYNNQIVYETDTSIFQLRRYRWYWIFNCKLYCPLSVALFRYSTYLVQIVENWWCPFEHDKKHEYSEAKIDKSYWHIYEAEYNKLNVDDRYNPLWHEEENKAEHAASKKPPQTSAKPTILDESVTDKK